MTEERRRSREPRRSEEREISEMKARMESIDDAATQAASRIERHEAVCAERYLNIVNRLDSGAKIMSWAGAALVGAMATIIIMLINLLMSG